MTAPTRPEKRPKSWHQRAGMPVRIWLAVLIIAGLTHPFLPESRWLLIHLFTLGAVTNSIVVWSQTLAERFLGFHLPETERGVQLVRIRLLNAGIVATVVGVVGGLYPVTLVGATVVGAMVAWHAVALLLLLRRAQRHRAQDGQAPAEQAQSVWFLIASASLLPIGAAFGATLAHGLTDPAQAGFLLAHQAMNLLGFLGLAAAGVLTVLYPRLIGMENVAARRRPVALIVLITGIAVLAVGALCEQSHVAAAGTACYLVGWLIVTGPMLRGALRHPPHGYAAASITAALLWLLGSLAALTVVLATGPMTPEHATLMTIPFLAGFAAQLLFGAMSHLLPTMMGGGPVVVGAGRDAMDRWWMFRLVVINVGLLGWLLPLPSWTKVAVSALVMAAFVAFLPIMVASARTQVTGRRAVLSGQEPPPFTPRRQQPGVQAVGALACLALVVAVTTGLGGTVGTVDAGDGVTPTGRTTTVAVTAKDMRFTPETIAVPRGNRLVLEVDNADTQVHDLVLDTGRATGRLASGARATLDVGVIGRAVEGWCSIVGHRQQGMVLHIVVDGAAAPDASPSGTGGHSGHTAAPGTAGSVDLTRDPGPAFVARDPALPPAPSDTVHRHTFEVTEVPGEFAVGAAQTMWTYNGKPMGPTLRGRLGDVFEITLVNNGTMGHSIDFHAGAVSPDAPMRTINPGESLVYRFTAERTGIWLYHCATAPMAAHIAAGMFGAVVIDPPILAPVSAEYLMVQSDAYLGVDTVDPDKVAAGVPDLVMFNGYADQYLHRPLHAKVGDRIRIWVLAAGPNEDTSFHVVGGQFDTVYKEGAYLLRPSPDRGGAQALDLAVAQGGFVEMQFTEPGTYTFLNHRMFDADRGARGAIVVE